MGIINIFIGSKKGKNGKSMRTAKSAPKKSEKKKGKFSQAEKTAFAAGKAFAAAKAGDRVQLRSKKQEESFRKGMQSVTAARGKE